MIISLDFETRSEVDLTKTGAYVYAQDPSTEVLCAAYQREGEEGELWVPGQPCPIKAGDTIRAYGAEFERCIIQHLEGWPDPATLIFECTQAVAAYFALPRRLEKACKALGVAEKDMDGHRVMMQMAKPRPTWKSKGTGDKYFGGAPRLEKLYGYCMDDVVAETAVQDALGSLPAAERDVYDLDQVINRRGVFIDLKAVQGALRIIEQHKANLCAEIEEITHGFVKKPSERDKILQWLLLQGCELPDLTKDTVAERLLDTDFMPNEHRVLQIRQEFMKKSTEKYAAMQAAAGADGRARGMFLYHAAGTGRWGGRVIQLQNLPRGEKIDIEEAMRLIRLGSLDVMEVFYDSPMNVLSTCLRSTLRAAPGSRFLVPDFSAIEARITMWLSGDADGLHMFRSFDKGEGPDPYIDQASRIYKCAVSGIDSDKRQVGKMSILGLGFGMGAEKFEAQLESVGVDISELDIEEIVKAYRTRFGSVKNMWYTLNRAAMKAVRTRQIQDTGYIKFRMQGRFLRCRLPSGRVLSYFDPRIETNRFDNPGLTYMAWKKGQWLRTETYGGKFMENVVQATARDMLVFAMQNAEAADYPTVIHVHDELVVELPYGQGSLEELEEIMSVSPPWAANCPITAEGWEGEYYRK